METDIGEIACPNQRAAEAGHVKNAQPNIVFPQNIEDGIVNPGFMAKFNYMLVFWW